ncbi:hypothetical protein HOLleu_39550 [Holothuria leucospilota]|uniref:Uncharacterized protein n=1 Tax=Holothuria leucospilota TaxID=206669 RepID=A0A9Q0YNG8_HOLLE|nr:hypothetical protein HOLleu_39550 [Holothuria leucospilota]
MKTSLIYSLVIVVSVVGVIAGQEPTERLTVRLCSNDTGETFPLCWMQSNTSITHYCVYLKNFINFVSDDTLISGKTTDEYEHTFDDIQLGFEYSGCVIPVMNEAADDVTGKESDDELEAFCKNIRENYGDTNSTCIKFTPSGWTFRESLAVACTVYLLAMYISLRLANIFCPYKRKATPLDFEKFYLYNERKHLKLKSKGRRSETVKRRVESIREKARRRSEAVSEAVSKSPRTPSSQGSGTGNFTF